ncbi:MAG: hypothetical protein O7I42_20450 [Alphaproteobacteria bacterium]|nr:hypothetical protein [Alphaproteobacteria bacterium]
MENVAAAEIDDFVFNPIRRERPSVLLLNNSQYRTGLTPFLKKNSPYKQSITDNESLLSNKNEIHRKIKYVHPFKKLASYANAVLEGLAIVEGGLSIGLSGLLNHQAPCAVDADLPKLYLIDEDEINPADLSEFLSLFQQIEPDRQPTTILISKDGIESAIDVLSVCGDNISVHMLTGSGARQIELVGQPCSDAAQFIGMFLTEADGACIATRLQDLEFSPDQQGDILRSATEMLRIQALFRVGRKFEASPLIASLHSELDRLRQESTDEAFTRHLYAMKAMANLWEAFVTEGNAAKIENSISIAHHLNDRLLLAHSLKLITLLHGHTDISRQFLQKSEQIFHEMGELEHSLFVRNNILVNSLYSEISEIESAEYLSDFVQEVSPYIRRSTTFHSNAGLSLLLSGNMKGALPLFERATTGSGPAVNMMASEVNYMIARYIDGQIVSPEEVWQHIKRLERSNIPKEFHYHQTCLYGNLWRLAGNDKDIAEEIKSVLREKMFLDYGAYLDDPKRLLKFAVKNMSTVVRAKAEGLPGRLGRFIDEHDLVPAAHVFYR